MPKFQNSNKQLSCHVELAETSLESTGLPKYLQRSFGRLRMTDGVL